MNLEINLVRTNSTFYQMCSLITRSRRIVNSDEEVMSAIIDFIHENIPTFDAAMADKEFVAKLQGLEAMTITDFYALKFFLSQSVGIDIIVGSVAEMEVNASEIAEGTYEYNVFDELPSEYNFVKDMTKIVTSSESGDMGSVYSKIVEMYGYFESPLFSSYRNPLKTNIELLKSTEVAMGVTPPSISNYINSVLEYLGKRIILITAD